MIRLNKYMSEAGVCSRREADRLIEAGKVTVDGMKATVGMQIEEGQKVCLNGKPVQKEYYEIAQELMDFEEKNIEKLKAYLR